MMLSPDTSNESFQMLTEMYRKMSPAEKLRRVFSAYETGKALAMAGLRRLHPNASETRIWHLWAKQHLGEELYEKVYGHLSASSVDGLKPILRKDTDNNDGGQRRV